MMFAWARERGAIDFSHWFFPLRGGGGETNFSEVWHSWRVGCASLSLSLIKDD